MTVLAGSTDEAARGWRRWAESQDLPVTQVSQPEWVRIVGSWAAEVEPRLKAAAAQLLANRLDRHDPDFPTELQAKGRRERRLCFKAAGLIPVTGSLGWLTRMVLESAEDHHPDRTFYEALIQAYGTDPQRWLEGVGAMCQLLGTAKLPARILVQPRASRGQLPWTFRAAKLLVQLASRAAPLPVALVAESDDLQAYFDQDGHSRTGAVLREGLVKLGIARDGSVAQRAAAVDGPACPAWADSARRQLVIKGAQQRSMRQFGKLVAQLDRLREWECTGQPGAPAEQEDAARSAAERFLFERLEAHPETRGRFELNGKLEQTWNDFLAQHSTSVPDNEEELARLLDWAISKCSAELDNGYWFETESDGRMVRGERHAEDNSVEPFLVAVCNKATQGGHLGRQVEEVERRAGEHVPVVVRSTEFYKTPTAKIARQLGQLVKRGGRRVMVEDSHWRRIVAFREFREQHSTDAGFDGWLKQQRPLSQMASLRAITDLDELPPVSTQHGDSAEVRSGGAAADDGHDAVQKEAEPDPTRI